MCMAEYIGHNKKVCWTLCLTTSLTRMRMGREPYWWNLEDSMKITKERHQLGSSWPIPMTVMWGGSQRVWGPDPWCNPTQPQDEISSRLSMSTFFQHTFTRWYPLESNIFLQRVAWSRQQERAWACWFQRRGRRASVLHETNYSAQWYRCQLEVA